MQKETARNNRLPFSCPMLCVSLAGATLLLALIFLLDYLDYISTEAAIWAAVGVFVAAAVYEIFLLSLVVKHMLNSVNEIPKES